MIYVGIDDTDAPGTPGTNHLARALAARVADRWACRLIVRHQLLDDPRVPCTSKNSAASILLEPKDGDSFEPLVEELGELVRTRSVEGSDPGLCVTATVPPEVAAFARRCQQELVAQQEARNLAARHGLFLTGLGGTEDGVIGALAAVGLAAVGNDGRVVQIAAWPDELSGWQPVEALGRRGVEARSLDTGKPIRGGLIDVGKHLRPNYRQHQIVLFARADDSQPERWHSVRYT